MSGYFNLWLAVSSTARTAYRARATAERNGTEYTGPMTARAYRILQRLADETVEVLFKSPTIGGKQYGLYSIYIDRADAQAAQNAVSHLAADYPNDIIVIGVWNDQTGQRYGALHPQAWRLMPDVIVYDDQGQVVSTTPASSLADMRDINLAQGQHERDFA